MFPHSPDAHGVKAACGVEPLRDCRVRLQLCFWFLLCVFLRTFGFFPIDKKIGTALFCYLSPSFILSQLCLKVLVDMVLLCETDVKSLTWTRKAQDYRGFIKGHRDACEWYTEPFCVWLDEFQWLVWKRRHQSLCVWHYASIACLDRSIWRIGWTWILIHK